MDIFYLFLETMQNIQLETQAKIQVNNTHHQAIETQTRRKNTLSWLNFPTCFSQLNILILWQIEKNDFLLKKSFHKFVNWTK